jgi:hypothetical protein
MRIDPHPLSITASGGKIMHRRTRQMDMGICDLRFAIYDCLNFASADCEDTEFQYPFPFPARFILNRWSAACNILRLRS